MPPPKKNAMIISQKKKDECNAKAQEIVLKLIDGVEDEEQFLEQLRWVNQSHYEDINEERAITKLCGYPICEQILGPIPKKKYHISVSQNKVYDITERKLFCSNHCYKANTYLKRQLHTIALWFGDREECEIFRELIGEEVNFEIERAKEPEDPQESENASGVSESNVIEHLSSDNSNISNTEGDQSISTSNNRCFEISNAAKSDGIHAITQSEQSSNNSNSGIHVESGRPISTRNNQCFELSNASKSDNKRAVTQNEITEQCSKNSNTRIHVESDRPISTSDNQCFELSNAAKSVNKRAYTQNKIIERPSSNSSIIKIHVETDHALPTSDNRRFKSSNEAKSYKMKTEKTQPSVADLVRHVEQSMQEWMTVESLRFILGQQSTIDLPQENEQVLNKKDEEPTPEPVSKALTDFEALRKQMEEIEMKVKEFYQGDRKVSFTTNDKEDTTNTNEERVNVLPVIHHHVQNATRRNLVLTKLKFVLPNLCDVLALNITDITSKVKQLMCTCCFSAHNITFKPLEWNLIVLIILKLLSVQDRSIQNNLQNKSNYVNAILESYSLKTNYLDCMSTWLTDPKFIQKNGNAS